MVMKVTEHGCDHFPLFIPTKIPFIYMICQDKIFILKILHDDLLDSNVLIWIEELRKG